MQDEATYYQTRVLQGLFSAGNSDKEKQLRVRDLTAKLSDLHFSGNLKTVFVIVSRYFYMTYALITPADFIDYIKSAEDASEAKTYEYAQLLASLRYGEEALFDPSKRDPKNTYLTDAEFAYAVTRLREQTQVDLYGTSLADTMQILTSGRQDGRTFLRGFQDAKNYYAQQLVTIEHVGGEDLPAGAIQDEQDAILQEYAAAERGETNAFLVPTGIREIDQQTGGGKPGEMWFITGFCQPAGELVLTEDGFKPIEQVTTGDIIPQQGKVLNTFVFPPKPLVEIKAVGCLPVRFSWDHPIAVVRRGKGPRQHTVLAHEVCEGDLVKLPVLEESTLPPDPILFSDTEKAFHLPIGEDLLTVLGAYLSDSSLKRPWHTGTGYAAWDTVELHFRSRTMSRLPLVAEALTSLGLPFTVEDDVRPWMKTPRKSLCVTSAAFGSWLQREFGHGSLGTRIPGWLLFLPLPLVQHFLSSYTDGNVPHRDVWASANKQMLSTIILMNARLGRSGGAHAHGGHLPNLCYRFTPSLKERSFKHAEKGFILQHVSSVTPLPAEVVYGIETESGWYYAPYLVHNTAEGKTTECINVAYNAMMNGQNVFFGTAETLREQVRRRLICRHSVHPKFGSPHGISGDKLKKGELSSEEKQLFLNVVDDLAKCPDYGKFLIAQIPKRCTVDYFAALMAKYETGFHIHVAVWDELRLAGVQNSRQSRREELNDIITDAKQMAVSHKHQDDTVGVLLLAPYQVSRAHWQEACRSGVYTKDCLSETSEAEKTADLIWSHLVMPETRELRCQILKYRDGAERQEPFTLRWVHDVCKIESMETAHTDLLD